MAIKRPTKQLRGLLKHINPKLKFVRDPFDSSTITKLKAEVAYVAGKKGTKGKYLYTTDSKGRIKTAAGFLTPKSKPRVSHHGNPTGKLPGDEAGHLIADVFDGSGGRENIVAQLKDVNQKQFKAMEKSWSDALGNGSTVRVQIDVDYGSGGRPTGFTVTQWVDGVKRVLPYIPN